MPNTTNNEGMTAPKPLAFTNANFDSEVLRSESPVLVEFWAGWCGACRTMALIVETVATQYAGKVKVGRMDVDANGDTALRYGIRGLPTLLLFGEGGRVVKKLEAGVGQFEIENMLDAYVEIPQDKGQAQSHRTATPASSLTPAAYGSSAEIGQPNSGDLPIQRPSDEPTVPSIEEWIPTQTRSAPTDEGGSIHARQLRLRDEILALPLPPEGEGWGDEREFALECNKIAEAMAPGPSPQHADVMSLVEKFRQFLPRKARLEILSAMCANSADALRDPLNYYAADEIRINADKGDSVDSSFRSVTSEILSQMSGMGAAHSFMKAASLAPRDTNLLRQVDAGMQGLHRDQTVALQVALLTAYFTDSRLKPTAQKYLLEWYRNCDVKAAQAALAAFLYAADVRGWKRNLAGKSPVIKELSEKLQGWKIGEGKTLEEAVSLG